MTDQKAGGNPRMHRARSAITGTVRAIRIVVTRRDTSLILLLSALAYTVLYSYTTGTLTPSARPGFDFVVVADPLARAVQQTGFLSFEPIARVQAFGFSYLFSPFDVTLALFLAVLVGVNLAVSYLGFVQPSACGLAPSSGILAAVPALISGAACCGPLLFIVLGIQATGVLFTGVQLLLPLSIILLIGSLLLIGERIDPTLIDSTA